MAHNISPERARAEAMACTLRVLQGYRSPYLRVVCPKCRGRPSVTIADLGTRCGWDRTLAWVVDRLRCQGCGAALSFVELTDELRRVTVVGVSNGR